jgi:hypothetical protein
MYLDSSEGLLACNLGGLVVVQPFLAEWNEVSSKWKIVLRDVVTSEERSIFADVFVYAVGRLNKF